MPRYKSRRLASSGPLILFLRDLIVRYSQFFYFASDSMLELRSVFFWHDIIIGSAIKKFSSEAFHHVQYPIKNLLTKIYRTSSESLANDHDLCVIIIQELFIFR